jgi:hypothetical protein
MTSCNIRTVYLGKPEAGLSAADVVRFRSKVPVGAPDACWLWAGSRIPTGYGQFVYQEDIGRSRHVYAHRVSYTLAHGPIPDGLEILHRCSVPACVNPAHLSVGTHLANMEQAAREGSLHVPRPKRQKLSDDTCDLIVARVNAGEPQARMVAEYGVSKTAISLLCSGQRRQYRAVPAVQREGTAA